jgi:hypothetical protein
MTKAGVPGVVTHPGLPQIRTYTLTYPARHVADRCSSHDRVVSR